MKEKLLHLFDITFWKFILIGIVNTLFGTGIMFVFYNIFHLNYWVSSASNYFFGSILSYFLNKHFTFQNKNNAGNTIPRFVLNISICYLVAYGLAKPLALHLLSGYQKSVQENVAMLFGMGLFVMMNYLGQRFFVFTSNRNSEHSVN